MGRREVVCDWSCSSVHVGGLHVIACVCTWAVNTDEGDKKRERN